MHEKITLAGNLGSGKSTVAKILTERLGMEYFSTGIICREVAAEHHMTVDEMNLQMETDFSLDREIDSRLPPLSDLPYSMLIDSRMAWHFVRGSFRVYLTTEPAVSAARIFAAKRDTEQYQTVEETERHNRGRQQSESKRYMQLYGVNNHDLNNYDLIVDTTYASPSEIADCMESAFTAWLADRSLRFCYLSPLRVYYPATYEAGDVSPVLLSEQIEAGERPMVEICYDGERFCVTGDPTVAIAYSLTSLPFIPCRLRTGNVSGEYVRMSDSL